MTSGIKKIQLYLDLVKFEHTIFALPFALSAVMLASGSQWPSFYTVFWVIWAMVGGRTYAMGLNRIIDCHIDGQNPRTQNRPLPAGRVKPAEAWTLTLVALAVMVMATFQLPWLCVVLLPVAVVILTVYSFVKRFSSLSHLVLGLALASSALGGWIAVTGQITPAAVLFGLAVLFWVAGFDIIYACQDVTFDREYGLFSIPASMGIGRGLMLSRLFHALTVILLAGVGWLLPSVGLLYWMAVAMTACMLVYEHSLVSPQDLSRVNEAFFMVNGVISLGVFVLVFADKLLLWSGVMR